MIPRRRRAVIAVLCAVAVTVGFTGTVQAEPAAGSRTAGAGVPQLCERFDRVATFPVFRNSSPDQDTTAEIAAATKDGGLVVNLRSSVSTYRMTRLPLLLALARNAAAPSIVSAGSPPIGCGALSGLDAAPGVPDLLGGLVAVEDNAYTPTRVLNIDSLR